MESKFVLISSILSEIFEGNDDDDLVAITAMQQSSSNSRTALCLLKAGKERKKHFRLGHLYRENLNWIDRYLDDDFHHRFRELVDVIRPVYPIKLKRGNSPLVSVEVAVLLTLNYLGHEMSMDDVGDKFGISLSSVHKEVNKVVSILCSLSSKFIVWPNENECPAIQQQFQARAGFPGVLGAIDGCHVEVLAPADDQDSYTDRKMNHSIILQGVCTATKIFTNVSIGTPGSRNDCRALAFSSLYRKISAYGPKILFYEDSYHLVGDKACPNRSWILTPFKNYGNLTRRQRNYNYKHSVTRVVIEHTFGLLKGRWRRLLHLVLKNIGKDSDFVLAACVLHNFCYLHNDTVIQEMVKDVRMLNVVQAFAGVHDDMSKQIGDAKREEICGIL